MTRTKHIVLALVALGCLLLPIVGWCGDPIQDAVGRASGEDYSPILRSFLLLSLLSFIPLMVIALTSFTRIIVVLSLVRSAIGLQQTPPNSVLLTLAMFLTLFSMNPVFQSAKQAGVDPYLRKEISAQIAVGRAFEPFKLFMIRQTREDDLLAVVRMAKLPMPKSVDDIGALQLIPALYAERITYGVSDWLRDFPAVSAYRSGGGSGIDGAGA